MVQTDKNDLFSDALILAILSATFFAMAYYYEKGFLEYFSIPPNLIIITPEKFFAPLVELLAIAWCLLLFLGILKAIIPKVVLDNWQAYSFIFGVFPLISLGYNYHNHPKWFWAAWIALVIAVIYCLGCILFLVAFGHKAAAAAEISSAEKNPAMTMFSTSVGKWVILCIFASLIIFKVPEIVGKSIAKVERNYLILEDNGSNYVLVRTYNDVSIFVEIHREWVNLYKQNALLGKKVLLLPVISENKFLKVERMAIKKADN